MTDPLVVIAVPVLAGAALIERWRRRAVRRYQAAERQARRRRELFGAVDGEYVPDYAAERREPAA
jgi:hypothetical protein